MRRLKFFGNSHTPGTAWAPPSIGFADLAPAALDGPHGAPPSAAYLHHYRHQLVASACTLAQNRPVYLTRPIPEMTVDVPRTTAHQLLWGQSANLAVTLADYHQRHDFIWAAQDEAAATCGADILNPLPWLCDSEYCSGTAAGRPMYYDDNHLSESGAAELAGMFARVAFAGIESSD